MLIILYGAVCLPVGRWWYQKSGYRPLVGYAYPFIAMIAALLLMISPVSQLLLWLGPIFQKDDPIEWVMLASAVQAGFLLYTWAKNRQPALILKPTHFSS